MNIISRLVIFLLLVLTVFYLALQSAPVQKRLTGYVVDYLSRRLKTEIRVGGVGIDLFSNIILKDVFIADQQGDTLLQAGNISVNVGRVEFDSNKFYIDEIEIIESKVKLLRHPGKEDFNFQFIIDAFASGDTLNQSPGKWNPQIASIKFKNSGFTYSDINDASVHEGVNFRDIAISNLNFEVNDFFMDHDTASFKVSNLSLREKSGFVIEKLNVKSRISSKKMEFFSIYLKTPGSEISSGLIFQGNSFNDYQDFITKIHMVSYFKRSTLDSRDLSFFAPELIGLDKVISFSGAIKGTVDNLKGRNMVINYGKASTFSGNIDLEGLPEINNTFILLEADELMTNKIDVESIPTYPFTEGKYTSLPDNLKLLGNIGFRGNFTGFLNDFVAYGKFTTSLGAISTDLSFQEDSGTSLYKYNGKINSDNFNVGVLTGTPGNPGRISLKTEISGQGFTLNSLKAKMNGLVKNIEMHGYNYRNLEITGEFVNKIFTGSFSIAEENIDLDFQGSMNFSNELPVFNFSSEIKKIYPVRLNLFKYKNDIMFSSLLNINLTGDDIDNITGNIDLVNLKYREGNDSLFLRSLDLSASQGSAKRCLELSSDFIDADVSGNFNIHELPVSFSHIVATYLPALEIGREIQAVKNQKFDYKIELKNIAKLNEMFLPDLRVGDGSNIKGTYNSIQNNFELNIFSPSLMAKGILFKDFYANVDTRDQVLKLNSGSSKLFLGDSMYVDRFQFTTIAKNNDLNMNILWDKEDTIKNTGYIKIAGKVHGPDSYEFQVKNSEMILFDTLWTIDAPNKILYSKGKITVSDLFIQSAHDQYLKLVGDISKSDDDKFFVEVSNFRLSNLKLFTEKNGFLLEGMINGSASFKNLNNHLLFDLNFDFNNLSVNDEMFGNGSINSSWDPIREAISVKGNFFRGTIPTINIAGLYYPNQEKNKLDFVLNLQKTQLQLFDNYVKDYVSDLKGLATGSLSIKGNPDTPEISGKINLQKTGFLINYLNARYSFSHEFNIEKTAINFSDLTLFDSRGNSALVDGKVNHKNFRNFNLDIDLDFTKFFCLNTTINDNESYYGEAYATGSAEITGPLENIKFNIVAKTEKGTKFFIPLEGPQEVSENSFIKFVNKDSAVTKNKTEYKADLSGIQLDFDLEITPDAEVQLIFDSKVGDIIKGKGKGNIKMGINTNGKFNMFGDYLIQEGEYLLTLQNVINKKFIVLNGGSVQWNGDPLDAEVKLAAVYKLRTNLSDLFQDTSEIYKKRIPVEAVLLMSGKLFNPVIDFDINMPGSNELETEAKNLIGKENMQQQVFSLLMLNNFFPSTYKTSSTISDAKSSGSELLSSQLSNWISQNLKKVDIGINYRPGDEINKNQEVEVALSTQLFNDKLLIDGNVGNTGNGSANNTTGIVGDAKVEYKLSRDGKLRVNAFHKTNENTLINNSNPSRQGIGISYREEFNTFAELKRNLRARFFRKKETRDSVVSE